MTSKHEWCYNLNSTTQTYIYEIKENIRNYLKVNHSIYENNRILESIEEMDELYYAKPDHNEGSDNVFVTPHIDGFFGWIPFMRLWRCIFCIKNPSNTMTYFPFQETNQYILQNGDFVCHDYNRDLHWISSSFSSKETRIVYKLHFYDYAFFMKPFATIFKNININYNNFARNTFLQSILPYETNYSYYLSCIVNGITSFSGYVEYYSGFTNICVALLIFYGLKKNRYMFHCTIEYIASFLCISQYLLGIITYQVFWRDILFYKSLSLVSTNKRASFFHSYIIYLFIAYCVYPQSNQDKIDYYSVLNDFKHFHQNPYNNFIHIVTTSLSFVGMFGIIQRQDIGLPYYIGGVYWIMYKYTIPQQDIAGLSSGLITLYAIIAHKYLKKSHFMWCIILILCGIGFQDLSHLYFREDTYLQSYTRDKHWIQSFILHNFWLVPFELHSLLS